MSDHKIVPVTCPRCRQSSPFTVWNSINTAKNPELREDVLGGTAFEFVCPECGNKINIKYDLLYHQVEDCILIKCAPGESDAKDFLALASSGSELSPRTRYPDYIIRLVRSQNQLKEKLRIFEAGLDDRIMEIVKLFTMTIVKEKNPKFYADEALFDAGPSGNKRNLMFFQGGKFFASTEIDPDMYEQLKRTFEQVLPPIREDGSILVDLNWAAQQVNALNEGET